MPKKRTRTRNADHDRDAKRKRERDRARKRKLKHDEHERKRKTVVGPDELPFPCSWGGARPGAGRKKQKDSGVPHTTRPALSSRYPVHVTIRVLDGLPSLRGKAVYRVLKWHIDAGKDRFGFRVTHYTVIRNHIHLICEAKDKRALSRGMQGLKIRIAKGLNKHWDRSGTVFAERYHAHILRTPREVRNAIAYVLHNGRRHGYQIIGIDFYSSGAWFDGWKEVPEIIGAGPPVVVAARTWLLTVGWRKHGLISVHETPKGNR